MKSVDDRVGELIAKLPYANKTEGGVEGFREELRLALLETAKDQRHACADATLDVPLPLERYNVNQAIMNAQVK